MTFNEFRQWMEEYRASREVEKQSQAALLDMITWYRRLPAEEQTMADAVVTAWLHSDNETDRFDGRVMSEELGIISALPALRDAHAKLSRAASPQARYEAAALLRAIQSLERGDAHSYAPADAVLGSWAARNQLHIMTRYRDEEVRSIPVADPSGNEFQIWLIPSNGRFSVHASNNAKRGKLRQWSCEPVDVQVLPSMLDEALIQVRRWSAE